MPKSGTKLDWSKVPIDSIIDREFGRNPEIKTGASAYADMLAQWSESGDGTRMLERVLDYAGAAYRAAGQPQAELVTFADRGVNFLFDVTLERAALIWGVSQHTAPGTRDNSYHAGYPSAGEDSDKGHGWSHTQGGFEGGPNYFKQARRLNRAISNNGKLWRAIETYLAANAGSSAFIRLIYARGNEDERPDEVEYGILAAGGQFRAVIFPNT